MIRLLKGIVIDRSEKALTLLVNGVGYDVSIPARLNLQNGQETMLHIHTHVREDTLALFGFENKQELAFFELLITVNGIGPKMAMGILDQPIEIIQNAIFTGNISKLTQSPGVGKKLAERLILELKGKVNPDTFNSSGKMSASSPDFDEDAVAALESLGYKRHHIQKVLSNYEGAPFSSEEAIRFFLQKA
ncbi:Holliday junction branch migration protein RuvA [Candidatus Peregrinibacteria bacterium]|nr:MAG: Holliday junction branch migration protein RuvA [Candidatus Peregrinibacteria bacterium]